MLRKFWILFLLLPNFAIAQEKSVDPSTSADRAAFKAEVKLEIAKIQNGAFLYAHSDRYHRTVDRIVALRLGIYSTQKGREDVALSEPAPDDMSAGSQYDQDETSVAISRKNPNVIIAGANDDQMYNSGMPAYVTTNAGTSWNTYRLPSFNYRGAVAGGDPMLICDDQGNFYYAFLIYRDNDKTTSNLMVGHSTDGVTWTYGNPVRTKPLNDSTFEDKESIAVDSDPSSPHYGRVYIVWMEFRANGTTQVVSYSDNKGRTWSAVKEVSKDYGYFSSIRVGKGGTVFIMSSAATDLGVHALHVSTDGGSSFTEIDVANFTDYPVYDGGYAGLKGRNGFRAFPYISFDVDRSNNDLYAIYGSFDDASHASLYTTESHDVGQSWSDSKQIVQNESGLDHFQPWLSVDQVTHKVYTAFYSSESDPNNVNSQFMLADYSRPDVFQPLDSAAFNPLNLTIDGDPFIGDYVGTDAYDGYYVATWTQGRSALSNDGDVYATVISPTNAVHNQNIGGNSLTVGNPSANPVMGSSVSFFVEQNTRSAVALSVYDERGVLVEHAQQSVEPTGLAFSVKVASLPAGVYRCLFTNGHTTAEKQIVVLH